MQNMIIHLVNGMNFQKIFARIKEMLNSRTNGRLLLYSKKLLKSYHHLKFIPMISSYSIRMYYTNSNLGYQRFVIRY